MDKPCRAAALTVSCLFTTDRSEANRRETPDQQSGGKKGRRPTERREEQKHQGLEGVLSTKGPGPPEGQQARSHPLDLFCPHEAQ